MKGWHNVWVWCCLCGLGEAEQAQVCWGPGSMHRVSPGLVRMSHACCESEGMLQCLGVQLGTPVLIEKRAEPVWSFHCRGASCGRQSDFTQHNMPERTAFVMHNSLLANPHLVPLLHDGLAVSDK